MPGVPSTLAISCGSETVATVPCTTAIRPNSLGASIELSMCTWASTKPGSKNVAGAVAVSSMLRDATVGDVNGARKDALAKHVDNLAGGGSDSRFGRQNRTPFHKPWAQLEGTADFIEPPAASVGPRFNR